MAKKTKKCSECEARKPVEEFHKTTDGFSHMCTGCITGRIMAGKKRNKKIAAANKALKKTVSIVRAVPPSSISGYTFTIECLARLEGKTMEDLLRDMIKAYVGSKS